MLVLCVSAIGFASTSLLDASQQRVASISRAIFPKPSMCSEAEGGTTILTCSRCKATYDVDIQQFGNGCQVQCSVCSNEWFQSSSRLHTLPSGMTLIDYPEEMKARLAAGKSAEPQSKYRAFVGNLAFTATEEVPSCTHRVLSSVKQAVVLCLNCRTSHSLFSFFRT